jgi:hypothetical protein
MGNRLARTAFTGLLFLLFMGIFGAERANAIAMQSLCDEDGKTNGDVYYGFYELTRGIKIDVGAPMPPNPVVVGQDPAMDGVSFPVTVSSQPGTITYEKMESVCGGDGYEFDWPQDHDEYGEECAIVNSGRGGAKYKIYKYSHTACVPKTDTVYRNIREVYIWLQPDDSTLTILGQDPDRKLGYVYPGNWNEEEIFISIDWGSGPFYAINFSLDELPFLRASGTLSFPEGMVILPRSNAPTNSSGWVLGVYSPNGMWPVSTKGWDWGEDHKYMPASGKDVMFFRMIYPKKLPIQYPGKWFVMVWARLDPAIYNNGTKTERVTDIAEFDRLPSTADTVTFTFNSYAIIAGPCDPENPKGCNN